MRSLSVAVLGLAISAAMALNAPASSQPVPPPPGAGGPPPPGFGRPPPAPHAAGGVVARGALARGAVVRRHAYGHAVGAGVAAGAAAADREDHEERRDRDAYREGRDVGYCEARYRSYDRRSGTYLGKDGRRRSCP